MDRLWYYHMIMVEFLGQVDQKFEDAERAWKEMESDLKLNGPKVFDDWASPPPLPPRTPRRP
ncbi:MAG: hypothetical protein U0R19_18615 [Bryobacteraceae bacterium]